MKNVRRETLLLCWCCLPFVDSLALPRGEHGHLPIGVQCEVLVRLQATELARALDLDRLLETFRVDRDSAPSSVVTDRNVVEDISGARRFHRSRESSRRLGTTRLGDQRRPAPSSRSPFLHCVDAFTSRSESQPAFSLLPNNMDKLRS